MNYEQLEYSMKMEAVSKDEDTNEMVCKLLTGHHEYIVKIPMPQFDELKKDGYFSLIDAKLSTQRFILDNGFISER